MKVTLVPTFDVPLDESGRQKRFSKPPPRSSNITEAEVRKKIKRFEQEIREVLAKGLTRQNRTIANLHLRVRNQYAKMIGEPEVEISVEE